MAVSDDVNKPVAFRPTKQIEEILNAYMKAHRIGKGEAVKRIILEWTQLTEKTQNPNPNPSTDNSFPKKWQDDYEKTMARERAKTDALVDRAERLSKVRIEQKQVLSHFSAYRGSKIGDFLQGDRNCPKGWNKSRCSQEPCERRQQCRTDGILATKTDGPKNTWDY